MTAVANENPSPCILCSSRRRRTRFEKEGRDFVECVDCGLVWIDPMPTPDALAAYYDEAYSKVGNYADFAQAHDIRRVISEHRLERIRNQVKPGRWLDVGASTGDFVAVADEAGNQAQGLEVSPHAVEVARSRGLDVRQGRVESFSPDIPYETITSFDVLEHLLAPHDFLATLRGWLTPGGHLVLTVPDVGHVLPRYVLRRNWFFYYPNEHLYYYDKRTIGALLSQHGFAIESIGPAYKPLTIHYVVRNLEAFYGPVGAMLRRVSDILPASLTRRPIRFNVGELMVVARRSDET